MKKTNRIIYSLNVEDVQEVARQTVKRKLTQEEISLVEESVGNHIDWFEAIESAILNRIEERKSPR